MATSLTLGALVSAGLAAVPPELAQARQVALEHIRPDRLLSQIKILASDEFEGRAPGSAGEERTVGFLVEQFKTLGLKPGNPDGTFLQNVPLMGVKGEPAVTIQAGGKPLELVVPRDCIASSARFVPEVTVENSEVVFVGYGVVAPEYGWDDYKGVDVRGKTIVMLVGDPPVPDPADASKLDEKVFKGRAMTYYGRWTYKYEIAAAKGAAAALIVHETGSAGYPYLVLVASHTQEAFDLQSARRNLDRVAVQGWLTLPKASELFAASGKNFETLKQTAVRRDFKPVPLNATAGFHIKNQLRPVASRNVIAKLENLLQEAARADGRTVTADSGPETGRFYRSDHFEFAKQGVPGLYLKGGIDLVVQPAGSGQQKIDEYTQRDYHKVTDEVKPGWDMSGGAEDLRLLLEVGWRVAQAQAYPTWKAGSEFKARREAMLKSSQVP